MCASISSGLSNGKYFPTTLPFLSMINLVKFHLIGEPNNPGFHVSIKYIKDVHFLHSHQSLNELEM